MVGLTNNNLGYMYYTMGQYDKAVEHYLKYLRTAEEIGQKLGIALASCNLGSSFLEISELTKAESYLLRAEKIFKELGDRYTLIETYLYLSELQIKKLDGEQYAENNKKETEKGIARALGFVDKAVKLAKEIDSKSRKGGCFLTYGKIYAYIYDFAKASEFFKKAIDIYTELNQKKSLADVYFEYGKLLKNSGYVFCHSGLVSESRSYFNKTMEIYQELKLEHKIKEVEKIKL